MNSTSKITHPVLILSGPTACGKTKLAVDFAVEYKIRRQHAGDLTPEPIEIISADSLTVYEGFEIGGAMPTFEERRGIPHHLLGTQNPMVRFDAAKFVAKSERLLQEIHGRGARALIVGGTGFYLKALLFGMWDGPPKNESFRERFKNHSLEELATELELKTAQNIVSLPKETGEEEDLPPENFSHSSKNWPYSFSRNDRYRMIRALEMLEFSGISPISQEKHLSEPRAGFSFLWMDRDDQELHERIDQRTKQMIEGGLLDEVKRLRTKDPTAPGLESVGYREAISYLDGIPPEGRKLRPGILGLEDEITLATRQLVKKQRTFFRGQFLSHEKLEAKSYLFPLDESSAREALLKIYP
jgi:tRNA dimethylallyltransferase